MKIIKVMLVIGVVFLLFNEVANAEQEQVRARIKQIVVHDDWGGGCYVWLDNSASTLSCTYPDYAHFDCSNISARSTSAEANQKLSLAQLAMVTDRDIYFLMDDSFVLNGFCYAERLVVNTAR